MVAHFVGPTTTRLDMAHDVLVAHDRGACEDADTLPRAGGRGCGPARMPEAASGLTIKALVNHKSDR